MAFSTFLNFSLNLAIRSSRGKLHSYLLGVNKRIVVGHLMWRTNSFENSLMLGKIESGRRGQHDRGWDGWMASMTQQTWVWVNSGSWWWTRRPGVLQFMGSQRVRHNWATELNWTDKGHYIMISGRVLQEYIEILNVYPPNSKTSKYLKKKRNWWNRKEIFF